MKDDLKRELRPGYSSEFSAKNSKTLNRRHCRKRLKTKDHKEFNNEN